MGQEATAGVQGEDSGWDQNVMEEMVRVVRFHYGRKMPLIKLRYAINCKAFCIHRCYHRGRCILELMKCGIQKVQPKSLATDWI